MRNIGVLVLLLLSASLVCGQATDRPNAYGRITGIVLDENGQLVENANVCTSVTKGNETYETCNVSTGESGQFQIEHLNLGSYTVSASKEQDGYSGYQQLGQKVTITPSQPDRNVTLRLGPRSGILVGSAKDKATGRPIVNAKVSVC